MTSTHCRIALPVSVVVVHTKQERVNGFPGEAQRLHAENGGGAHALIFTGFAKARRATAIAPAAH